ncbi:MULTISPECIES: MerR family DNA-binding transcriptional regulator [unclassified Streptomyces]|uniref:MerR family DNA-binding transcriptional regulator n=1 Tax=unclassified Streptomyces TaxID=2593676 RepID=UPI00214AB2AA|nr:MULTISPECIES: MerR family DNA-binding transcriptional regulator [unclassified Streptomyces]MCX5613310.1 MerR family DNA-binding transcriptional regulator [Streptomyces sp. NBC_00047]UUU37636.1 MerR family DNA-binding transcriptional regulator [Streptomyces sp. NBC_00162]
MAWSIAYVAGCPPVTSQTLRHYHDIGLLPPAYIASNGQRCYGKGRLPRLQRILLSARSPRR